MNLSRQTKAEFMRHVDASDDGTPRGKARGPSREEIETLCILHVVECGAEGAADIAEALGLARDLAPVVARAIEAVAARGYLTAVEDRVSLTDGGRVWLQERTALR